MKKIFIIISVLPLAIISCRQEPAKNDDVKPVIVRVTQIEEGSVVAPVQASGIVSLSEEIKLSFKTGGILKEVLVEEGERVKKGETLASLNLTEIRSAVDLSGVSYDKVRRDWERVRNLYADTVATLEQLQNAESAMKAAVSNLEMARFNLTHSKIVAPDNGLILKQIVKEGELVSSGYPVLLFGSEGGAWRIKSGLSDRDLVRINIGDSAIARFDAWPGELFSCIVMETGSLADQSTGTYEVELEFDTRGKRFASGFIGSLEIFPSAGTVMKMVPVEAIIGAQGDEAYVFSVSDTSTVVRHKIKVMGIFGEKVGIINLPEGVKSVVYEGNAYLNDGVKVEIVNQAQD